MNDIEMVKACAEIMGYAFRESNPLPEIRRGRDYGWEVYNPYHDDAQCFALVRKCLLWVRPPSESYGLWTASTDDDRIRGDGMTLNAAIVECVAKLHAAQTEVE